MNVPLSSPDITVAEIDAVVAVLRGTRLSLGPKVTEFESAIANYVGAPHAVAVSSGTAGLHVCVRALGIGEGDEVLLPSFTFIAAANVIRYERATPVFVDIDEATLNMDASRIEAAITPRTKAIMAVHTFGVPCEMDAILDIARRHRLLVIEDACEAIGAETGGRRVGSLGDAGVFAFYPNKQMTTGEGGVVVTRDAALAARGRALANQGRTAGDDWFQHAEVGYNYRISDINCALGIEQLRRIDAILNRRAEIAATYNRLLGDVDGVMCPRLEFDGKKISWFVYVVRLGERFGRAERDRLIEEMRRRGVQCGRYFAPIHLQPSYAEWREATLPVTERVADRALALPFFNRLSESQMEYVCECMRALLIAMGR